MEYCSRYYSYIEGTIQVNSEDASRITEWLMRQYGQYVDVSHVLEDSNVAVLHLLTSEGDYRDLKLRLQEFCNTLDVRSIDITRLGDDDNDVEKYRLVQGTVQSCIAVLHFPEDGWV